MATRFTLVRLLSCLGVLLLCWTASTADAFGFSFMRNLGYTYEKNAAIAVVASSVVSRSKIVPLRWSDVMPCAPLMTNETIPPSHRNIGQVLMGDALVSSGMKVAVLQNTSCTVLCKVQLSEADAKTLEKRIQGRYRVQLFLDGLPVKDMSPQRRTKPRNRIGLQLGNASLRADPGMVKVYNHFHFVVHYYVADEEGKEIHIVQFDGYPQSVHQKVSMDGKTCTVPETRLDQTTSQSLKGLIYSYSVDWVRSETAFTTRWDAYVDSRQHKSKMHWYSIFNVFFLVLLQSVLLWYIFVRAVRRDISSYNEEDLLGDREDSGWKLVYGDVFRPPRGAAVLSMLVGNGFQLVCMSFASLMLAVVGMVAPGSRGMLITLFVMLFVFFASVNGLVTATLIKFFKRRSWRTIALTGAILPGFLFTVYLALNFIYLGNHAASVLPFTSLLYLLSLWLLVSVPLCFVGAVAGFSTTISIPVKVNSIPRTIPPQPWYMRGIASYVALGIVPFTASYVELQFVFSSVWLGAGYHMFGFLTAAFFLVMAIVAQISIFATYYQLNLLNYHWWWRSFLVSASYGAWLMVYCVFYYFFISIVKGFWSTVLYFSYMGLASLTASLMFGAVGFIASLTFVRIVYSSVKVD